MEKYDKPWLSYGKQLELLIKRGLIVSDREKAEKFLSQINYYRFSAYCQPFEIERDKFRAEVTFEKIQELYEFDRRLRFFIHEALELIEVSTRTAIAYYLARKCGKFAHESDEISRSKEKHSKWLEHIHAEIESSKEIFIDHYREKYKDFPKIPIWMATEVMSFGTLSSLYSTLLSKHQINISNEVGGYYSSVLFSWLLTFSNVRNICAHHSRVWNRRLAYEMNLPRNEGAEGAWKTVEANRIGAVIFAINDFMKKLPIEENIRIAWQDNMNDLLNNPVDIPEYDFCKNMGLLDGWKESSLWKR